MNHDRDDGTVPQVARCGSPAGGGSTTCRKALARALRMHWPSEPDVADSPARPAPNWLDPRPQDIDTSARVGIGIRIPAGTDPGSPFADPAMQACSGGTGARTRVGGES